MEKINYKPVLLVVCDEDEGNKFFLKGYDVISSKAQLISARVLPRIRKRCDLPDCSPGDILIEHPFKSIEAYGHKTYIRLESNIPEDLRRQKLQNICSIATALGAIHCTVINATGTVKKRNLNFNAQGEYGYVGGETSLTKEIVEKDNKLEKILSESIGLEDLTENDYNTAWNLACSFNLLEDPEVKRLLDERNPNNKNKLKKLKVEINTQSEINNLIDIAATFWAMPIFNMHCNYRETLESRTDYHLTLEFEFP